MSRGYTFGVNHDSCIVVRGVIMKLPRTGWTCNDLNDANCLMVEYEGSDHIEADRRNLLQALKDLKQVLLSDVQSLDRMIFQLE